MNASTDSPAVLPRAKERLYSIAAAVVGVLVLLEVAAPFLRRELPEPDESVLFLVMIAFALLGALVLWRRPGNAMGWVFSAMGLTGLMAGTFPDAGIGGIYAGFGWFSFLYLTVAILPLLYPTGRPLSPRWRWLLIASLITFAGYMFLWLTQDQVCEVWSDDGEICLEVVDNPIGITGVENPEESTAGSLLLGSFLVASVASLVSLGIRFKRARGVERQQIKLLLFALAALVGFIVVVDVVLGDWLGIFMPDNLYDLLVAPLWLALPVTCGIAIFRYGLYDIDRIINRTVAYTLLIGGLTAGYAGIVIGVGALVENLSPAGGGSNLPLPLMATAVVAIAFQPVRRRANALANRMVYGKRTSPYEALAGVSGESVEELLPQIARLATESTAARQATVWMSSGLELRPSATFPVNGGHLQGVPLENGELPTSWNGGAFPLKHQDYLMGAITVKASAGDELRPDDNRLLADLAAHASVTLKGLLDAAPLPTGVLTFLMTDIEGSTRLWDEDAEAMAPAIREHDALVRQTVTDAGGMLIKWKGEGDSTFSVFTSAAAGVQAAIALQAAIGERAWPTSRPIRTRAALHTGEAELRERDYFGPTINRCARLRAIAVGGQTLVSAATRELAREGLPDSVAFEDLGERQLKDMTGTEHVYEVR